MGVGAAWILAALALFGSAAYRHGRAFARESRARLAALVAAAAPSTPVDTASIESLPAPVSRYLRRALGERRKPIRTAVLEQEGELRTDVRKARWSRFTAVQTAGPPARGFVWEASVQWLGPVRVRVVDSYLEGEGSGRVSLFSMLPLDAASGGRDMKLGSLLRYLGEAAWFPTALLPQSGIAWSAIDERRALATLRDGDAEVSLEFRFDEAGDIASIHSPGRPRRTRGGFEETPWEGRFSDYQARDGLRVPGRGEVGWWIDGRFEPVWRGRVTGFRYDG